MNDLVKRVEALERKVARLEGQQQQEVVAKPKVLSGKPIAVVMNGTGRVPADFLRSVEKWLSKAYTIDNSSRAPDIVFWVIWSSGRFQGTFEKTVQRSMYPKAYHVGLVGLKPKESRSGLEKTDDLDEFWDVHIEGTFVDVDEKKSEIFPAWRASKRN